jgi:hypothetical protein
MTMKNLLVSLVAVLASGCDGNLLSSRSGIFVLYRNSVLDQNARIHVATFDASDGENYNRANCAQASELFQAQPGVTTRFRCEMG